MKVRNGESKTCSCLLRLGMILAIMSGGLNQSFLWSEDYFVSRNGQDVNSGKTIESSWKTLHRASRQKYKPGDRLLLQSGETFLGELSLIDQHGEKNKLIIITSTDPSQQAIIDCRGYLNGVYCSNSSWMEISHLTITGDGGANSKQKRKNVDQVSLVKTKKNRTPMRCGLLIQSDENEVTESIKVDGLNIKNLFYHERNSVRDKLEVHTANGSSSYAYGIRLMATKEKSRMRNIEIKNCVIENLSHTGIRVTGKNIKLPSGQKGSSTSISDIKIRNNDVIRVGGPGIQVGSTTNAYVGHNIIDKPGSHDDTRKWGRGSGMWTWGCDGVLMEHNKLLNAFGPADSFGAHIDFNCRNIIVQYNLSYKNYGGFIEVLGNNFNCAYRYNVSINDGWRVRKAGQRGQEGKTLFLSGYTGRKGKKRGPFNTYIYNNTIYVDKSINPKISIFKKAEGVLIANNIFYSENPFVITKGDQNNLRLNDKGEVIAQSKKKSSISQSAGHGSVYFENNLFLKPGLWPSQLALQDMAPIHGDPKFMNRGGGEILDYIPQNHKLIKGKGVSLSNLSGDETGLSVLGCEGLSLRVDILGRPVGLRPSLGAIEPK